MSDIERPALELLPLEYAERLCKKAHVLLQAAEVIESEAIKGAADA